MADSKTKVDALLLGMPKGDDDAEEDVDVGADRESTAATAFLKAVKGSDPDALVSAYRELKEACEASYKSEAEPEEG